MKEKFAELSKPKYINNEHWLYQNQLCVATTPVKEIEGEKYIRYADIQHLFTMKKCD